MNFANVFSRKGHQFCEVCGLFTKGTISKSVYTSSTLNKKIEFVPSKQVGMMQKLLIGTRKSNKRNYMFDDVGPMLPSPLQPNFKPQHSKRNLRRVVVLNSLFTQYITDMLSTGELSQHVLGLGLEISRVKVANDYSIISVYWLATGHLKDDILEKTLKSIAGRLRHELSQLHLIGRVPYITFVKDKQYAKTAVVERLLAQADFGEEFVPTDPSHEQKSVYIIKTQLSPELKAKIEQLENVDDAVLEKQEDTMEDLPDMRMDVLCFDHARALSEIKLSMNKSKALHRLEPQYGDGHNQGDFSFPSDTDVGASESSSTERNEDFAQFLLKRQRLKAKAQKGEKNALPEREYYLQQAIEQRQLLWEREEDFEEESDYEDDSIYDESGK